MSKKKTTPQKVEKVKKNDKKTATPVVRTSKEIACSAQKNFELAHKLFMAALTDMSELSARLAKTPVVKEKAAPVKEKVPVVKEKKAGVKEKAAVVKQAPVAEPVSPSVKHRTPMSVRLTPQEITLNIGSQPVRALAENDAKDFLNNPKVFWYRPTQFPDPKRYGIQPRIEAARVIERKDPKFTRAPWTVSVTIAITGDPKRAESWGTGVYTKNKADQE